MLVSSYSDFPAGTQALKEEGSPKVYLVGPGGKYHIPDPATAARLANDADWSKFVSTVPAGQLTQQEVASAEAAIAAAAAAGGGVVVPSDVKSLKLPLLLGVGAAVALGVVGFIMHRKRGQ